MSDFTQFPEEKKKALLSDLWDRRKPFKGAKRTSVQSVSDTPSTDILTASLEKRVLETVWEDIGADANFMDQRILDRILSSGTDFEVEERFPLKLFDLAAGAPEGSPSNTYMKKGLHAQHGNSYSTWNCINATEYALDG